MATVREAVEEKRKKNKNNEEEKKTSLSVREAVEQKRNSSLSTNNTNKTPTFDYETGKKGWQKYLDDQSSAEQKKAEEKEDEKWWETLGRYLGSTGATDTTLSLGNTGQIINDVRNDTSYQRPNDDWTEDQQYEFGALYLESPGKAYSYAEKINNENNKAKEAAEIEKIQNSATSSDWGKIGHTAGAIASAGLSWADYLNMLVLSNAGRDPLASDGIVSPFEYSTAVTEGISTDLNNAYGTLDENIPIIGGKGWGDVYGLGTSIAQSAATGYLLGPVGTLVSYVGQGAASGMKDALERGAGDWQAAVYGLALGTFEGVAEMIGIDNLFKIGSSSTIKGLLKNILKQAGAEGMEEGLTSIFSNIADNVIMQDKSNFYAMVAEYMKLGMSEEEAKKKAWMDSVEGIAFDTIAGAVSGGVHGGASTTIQTGISNYYTNKYFGNQAQNIVNDALNSPHSDVQAIGQKYQDKLDSGKKLSGWNLNELIEVTDTDKIKNAVLQRLGELGETSDVTAVADVLVKQAMGEELSSRDQNILNQSKYGNLVATELNEDNIKSGGVANNWAAEIGTRKANPEVYNKTQIDATKELVKEIVTKKSKYKTSEDGKTTLNDQEVSIQGVESIKGGEVTVRLESGETVNASDLKFSDKEALMYDIISRMDATPDTANKILNEVKPVSVAQASMYYNSIPLAYEYGKINYEAGLKNINLPKALKQNIYTRGRIDAMIRAEAKTPKTNSDQKGSNKTKSGIIYEDGFVYDEASANEMQRVSMAHIEVINKMSNLEVHIFESKVENGKRVAYVNGKLVSAPNGYFKDGNKIYIDFNAGNNGEGAMLYTMSHEITHYIREWNAKGFKELGDFLIEQYGKKGVNVEYLLEQQRKKIKKRYAAEGKALPSEAKLNDMAYEEMVADAMSDMLADPKAYEKLAKLKQQNKTLWEKVGEAIKAVLDKLKAALGVYKERDVAVAREAFLAREFSFDAYDKLQDLYIKVFVEADANYEASKDSTKTASEDAKHSERDDDIATKINQSMTMAEAKRMVESAYKVNNIAEYYEDEYKDAEDWLRKAGPDEVEMYIENDYDLQAKYVNSNEDILNEEYRISDVLNAYLAGTLVGKAKPKAKRLDVSKSTKLKDSRFYSPQKIEDAKATFELAKQKAVGKDAAAINRARAEILLFAHNKGAAELLGVTQAELNKRLRSWSNYSATAKSISERINAGVAEENRWTGIENSSYINKARVTNEDIERLVASVEGDSRGYERKYIARVMLAADTHIDYSGLKFKFATSQQVNQDNNSGGRVLGFYNDTNRLIEVTHDKPHTVAHEMGHYIDAQWGRDLLGSTTSSHFLTRGINENMVRDRYGEQGVQFLNNFKIFINSLTDVNSNNSSYTNDRAEVFARFFARFVEWTDNIATGNRYYSYETSMYNDKFTQAQYIEFARLLQEKALLDGSLTSFEEPKFSDIDILYSDRNPREVTESDVRYILDNIESYDKDSYFPVRVNTPHALIDAAKKRGDIIENLPVVMQVKKAQQAMSDEAPRSSIERSHGLSSDDMIAILRAMDNPAYIVYQENGRYAEIVRFETEAKKRAIAILEIGENKNAIHMNGYEGGIYQILVTAFIPDNYKYIKGILDNKKNTILPIEKKKGSSQRSSGSQVPSLLNESPFFEDSIPQNTNFVNREFENSDIMYSDRRADVSEIKDELERLNIETRDVISLADSYFSNYGGVMNRSEIRYEFLRAIKIMSETTADSYDQAFEKIVRIADELSYNPKVPDNIMSDLKEMKNHIRSIKFRVHDIDKPEFDKYGGFGEFRKRHMGKLILANDGISVDSVYKELQGLYGTSWFPEVNTVSEQLMQIADVVDTDPASSMELDYDPKEASRQTVDDIVQRMADIISASWNRKRDNKADKRLYINERGNGTISNRTLLANALETTAKTEKEKEKLKQYKTKIALIESEQDRLTKIRAEIKKLSFAKGPRDSARIASLQETAAQIESQINKYDRQLLNLESTEALKGVLQREKQMAYKKAQKEGREALQRQKEKDAETVRTLLTQHRESRQRATESRNKTAMKAKIKKVVHDLNKLLLNPTQDKHVPIGLQKVVAEALDAINMDSMNAEERVAYYNDLISKSSDPDEIAILTKKRDFFEYRDMNFKERITELKNAYAEFKESDDPLIRNAHNDAIADLIKNTADEVGNKSLKDMSLSQLERVYDMYKAILATVRNANKMFKEGRQETVTENSDAVKLEVRSVGGHKDRVLKMTKFLKKFGWDMLKPVTAMKVIGSTTFERLFNNVRAAEDTWAVDVNEAKQFFDDIAAKYGYNKWDLKKYYTFKDSAGTNISITLEQIMSLYAYSKRNQADKHLEDGGFVFDDAIEVIEKNKLGIPLKYEVNDANPYRLRKEHLLDITDALTKEQKDFVDAMQTYLSDVMGAKGNEVSLAMYDIKLYKEQNYFPLKTSRYFREFDPEKSATPKIKNSGFSKKTVPQAGNPIVLSNFMDVWAGHVNDMSMYHAFVLPLEDFMRVYNYSSTTGGYDSVQQYIKNAYGAQANQYIEKLMDDLNGGARVDSSAGIINKGLSLFKKASVFASASVVVQQPSAIARALAYINPKYFAKATPEALNIGKHKTLWAEVKKYAPVAVIKEMGYFDTGVGRSTVDWIKGNQTFMDKMDDILSKAPAIADELCWVHIWEAVKRENAAKSKSKVGSEIFLMECGKRFTEVITNTQVYDSVLSRSGMMRSKDTGMKMATAFMAEPTTTVNMMVDGIVQGIRGNKKFTASTVGAISASIILNAILVSLVYAARDDDEDETYTEKYIGSVTSELLDGFNPLTYIPFVKDIWSIAQGYDVERSDMSVVSKLWESIESLFDENKSGLDKVLEVSGSISSLFGIPLKNIIRDAKGMYNLTNTILSGTPTTGAGIKDAIEDSFKSSIPLWDRLHESDSKSDKLYDAIISGDQNQIDRVKAKYKSEQALETALKTALRENDSRINEAAQARLDGNISEYTRIAREIIAEGHFSQDTVVGAINAEMNAIKKAQSEPTESTDDKDEVTSIYSTSDINVAFDNGDKALALSIIDEIVEMKVANGMDEAKAKSSLRSSMTSYWKPLYIAASESDNTSEMQRIKQILYYSGLYGSAADVVKAVKNWTK